MHWRSVKPCGKAKPSPATATPGHSVCAPAGLPLAFYRRPLEGSYRTTDGTATIADHDYVAQTGTLTFNPGETMKTITIFVNGDSKKEANEMFYLDLFGNSGNSLFIRNRGIGTILNDD
jgi:hypothetical protein